MKIRSEATLYAIGENYEGNFEKENNGYVVFGNNISWDYGGGGVAPRLLHPFPQQAYG